MPIYVVGKSELRSSNLDLQIATSLSSLVLAEQCWSKANNITRCGNMFCVKRKGVLTSWEMLRNRDRKGGNTP